MNFEALRWPILCVMKLQELVLININTHVLINNVKVLMHIRECYETAISICYYTRIPIKLTAFAN